MGPKYKFHWDECVYIDTIQHKIMRVSNHEVGGWIEKEENLSQEGNCWVDFNAYAYGDARVYGNAQIKYGARVKDNAQVYGNAVVDGYDSYVTGNACVYGNARVYNHGYVGGNAKVYDHAEVYDGAYVYGNAKVYDEAIVSNKVKVHGNAEVYGNARVCGNAKVFGDAQVYGRAKIYGNAEISGTVIIHGNAEIYGDVKITSGEYTDVKISCEEDLLKYNELKSHELQNCEIKKAIQDFIYKVDNSNNLTTQTEYDSIDEFFSEHITNDIKLDTLIICAVDTKEPLIKLQKVEVEDKTEFKFIVEINTKDGDNFTFKSIIKSQEHLNQSIQRTIEALKQYPEFSRNADDLEECL